MITSLNLFLIVLLYYVVHSLLANDYIKSTLYKVIPSHYYRLLYTILSIAGLFWIIQYYLSLPQEFLFNDISWLWYLGVFLAFTGLVIIHTSLFSFDLMEFLGFKQLMNKDEKLHDPLNQKGLYRIVRHPLYFGFLVFFLGLFLFRPDENTLIISTVSIVYTLIGAKLEEKRLINQYGEQYLQYISSTPFIIPFTKF